TGAVWCQWQLRGSDRSSNEAQATRSGAASWCRRVPASPTMAEVWNPRKTPEVGFRVGQEISVGFVSLPYASCAQSKRNRQEKSGSECNFERTTHVIWRSRKQ